MLDCWLHPTISKFRAKRVPGPGVKIKNLRAVVKRKKGKHREWAGYMPWSGCVAFSKKIYTNKKISYVSWRLEHSGVASQAFSPCPGISIARRSFVPPFGRCNGFLLKFPLFLVVLAIHRGHAYSWLPWVFRVSVPLDVLSLILQLPCQTTRVR